MVAVPSGPVQDPEACPGPLVYHGFACRRESLLQRFICIHGHFYQPPRENPWTQEVEREQGAEPFHDWNERIDDECYRPNGFGRIVDDRGQRPGS